MSYYFGLSFVTVKNRGAVFDKAKQFSDTLAQTNAAKEHLANHMARFKDEVMFRYGDANKRSLQWMIGFWVKSLFQVNYLYWPQHELLGIVGTEWPKPCLRLAPHMVIFQDGTDQDYEQTTWNRDIPLFDKVLEDVAKRSEEQVRHEVGFEDADYLYSCRSLVYKRIFSALDLDNFLYNGSGNFERFVMSGNVSAETHFKLVTTARQLYDKEELYE